MSLHNTYPGVSLPRMSPVVDNHSTDDIKYQSLERLKQWQPYVFGTSAVRSFYQSILETNIENGLRHVTHADEVDPNFDGNRMFDSPRPQSALLLNDERVKSVELLASLLSSEDEPHNALSLFMAQKAMAGLVKDDWTEPLDNEPRPRLKVMRYFPEDDPGFVVVRSKIDQTSYHNKEIGVSYHVKARRSGYLELSQLDESMLDAIATIIKTPELLPDSVDLTKARVELRGFLSSQPEVYHGVIDRAYITRMQIEGQSTF